MEKAIFTKYLTEKTASGQNKKDRGIASTVSDISK